MVLKFRSLFFRNLEALDCFMYSLFLVLRRKFFTWHKKIFLRQTLRRVKLIGNTSTSEAPDFRRNIALFEGFQA
jgi:hypothetical protein